MDRDQQRQNRRTSVLSFSCTAGAELNPLQNPAGRTGAACDPIPAAPAPFTAVAPPPCQPAPPVALNLPDGLIVPSDAAVAYCPSTAGYSVTGTTAAAVTAGAQNQTVLFTTIPNITENQLNYLYQVVPGSSAAIIAAALSGATSSVIDLTHLNYTQSEDLISSVQDAKFVVNTLAVEQSRNLLICQAESNLQVASCPTSAYFGPSAGVPTGMMYTPSATSSTGAVLVTFALTSTTGDQANFTLINIPSLTAAAAQANLLALAQAENALRCVFGNDATAAACCTSQAPDNNLGYTAACVPATGPTISGSATAVGYFSVPENTVFSIVSKDEANSVARDLSRNSLNCYFPSEGVTATCVGLGKTGPFATTSTTSFYLEPGAIILYGTADSVTAANVQALDIAVASLNCFWSNSAQSVTCPPSGTFVAIDNQDYNLAASPTASIHYSSTTVADTVISYVSQEDANEQALQLAQANISCVYCNESVPPTCTGGVNETIGATANLICNTLAEIAQNTALSLGSILVSTSGGQLNCCYGNDAVFNNVFCGSGAYRNTNSSFTSVDSFFIPENVITVCFSTTGAPTEPTLFQYSNLYAGTNPQAAACLDTAPCAVTAGSATALPALWASQTDLFSAIAAGATFYSNTAQAPYAFDPTYPYIVDRSYTNRSYRTVTGGTGFTLGLTAYTCSAYTSYTFRGATLGNYLGSSAALALEDIFCSSSGPTASLITLYSDDSNPFTTSSTSSWYTDTCGLSAFNPVENSSTAAQYYAGIIQAGLAAYIVFSASGSNIATYQGLYNLSTCSTGPWPDTNPAPTSGTASYVSYTPETSTGSYKQEANSIAQNIVNSFVKCFYLNDEQVGTSCSLGQITVRQGYVAAGEVVSNISKEDANATARTIANNRTVCLTEDEIGNCAGTTIDNSSVPLLGASLDLTFSKAGCSFTPTLNINGNFDKTQVITSDAATIKKLTICGPSGSEDIYVPYWTDYVSEGDTVSFLLSPTGTESGVESTSYFSVNAP